MFRLQKPVGGNNARVNACGLTAGGGVEFVGQASTPITAAPTLAAPKLSKPASLTGLSMGSATPLTAPSAPLLANNLTNNMSSTQTNTTSITGFINLTQTCTTNVAPSQHPPNSNLNVSLTLPLGINLPKPVVGGASLTASSIPTGVGAWGILATPLPPLAQPSVGRDGGGNVDNEQQILQNIQQLQAQIAANNKSALKLDVSLSSPIGAPLSAPTATSATASSSAELLNVLLGNRPQSNTSLLPARSHLSQLSVTASALIPSTLGMSRKGGPGVVAGATVGLAQKSGVGVGGRRESGGRGGGEGGGGGGDGGGVGVKATDTEQQQLKEQIELLELQIKLQIQNAGGGSRPSWF
jgi:hypothetical protein